jgi:hypothetical protein
LEERFEPFGFVLEAATNVGAFERLVVAIVSGTKIVRHIVHVVSSVVPFSALIRLSKAANLASDWT